MKKSLYIFSGLGADERAFQKLDFSDYTTIFIKWEIPKENETIKNYATRLIDQIKTENPIFIGLSFGGLIAIEVAKQIETEKIILIASTKTKKEIPFYFRLAGKLRLHRVLPIRFLKTSNFLTNWFFGTTSQFDKHVLKQILSDTNSKFLKWALDCLLLWKNDTIQNNIIHIHGSSDRLLPHFFVKSNIEVRRGGHLMTLNKSDELNKIIKILFY